MMNESNDDSTKEDKKSNTVYQYEEEGFDDI